jgi:hypothetical protein
MDHPEEETKPDASPFDFEVFPSDTLFHERRECRERRRRGFDAHTGADLPARRPSPERRVKKERRKRIDPTTFDKQYTEDEVEFMNAMQRFKVQTGKAFLSHGDVIRVAYQLGYRKEIDDDPSLEGTEDDGPAASLAVADGPHSAE